MNTDSLVMRIVHMAALLLVAYAAGAARSADVPEEPLPVRISVTTEKSSAHWIAGTHYQVLQPALAPETPPGTVEVLEMFWYGCSHCADLEPYLEKWQKEKHPYIKFVRVPVIWRADQYFHARLFYTLEALGRGDLHRKVFHAITVQQDPLFVNDEAGTLERQVQFAKAHHIDEDAFRKAYNSLEVAAQLLRASERIRRYKAHGVPFVVINGKYTSDLVSAGGQQELIALINALAAKEKPR